MYKCVYVHVCELCVWLWRSACYKIPQSSILDISLSSNTHSSNTKLLSLNMRLSITSVLAMTAVLAVLIYSMESRSYRRYYPAAFLHPSWRPVAITQDIQCPDGTTCPDASTCCVANFDNDYYCCPHANAECCSDLETCCRPGWACNFDGDGCRPAQSPWNIAAGIVVLSCRTDTPLWHYYIVHSYSSVLFLYSCFLLLNYQSFRKNHWQK